MTDTMTRDVVNSTYRAVSPNNPPPLHVRSDQAQGAWFPYRRPFMMPDSPGPLMVGIPGLPADEYGEDPTDPARCHSPRIPTMGLVARLDVLAGATPNVGPGGVRR